MQCNSLQRSATLFQKFEEPAELAAEAQMQITERKGNLNLRARFAKM